MERLVANRNQDKARSRPARARGLEQSGRSAFVRWGRRAPHGRVDWNVTGTVLFHFLWRRAPHGRVDWNQGGVVVDRLLVQVAPRTGAWIGTMADGDPGADTRGRAPHGRVDWNIEFEDVTAATLASRPARARGLELVPPAPGAGVLRVAPRTGAWIGTPVLPRGLMQAQRRAPHGRVDWNHGIRHVGLPRIASRPARARGLEQGIRYDALGRRVSRPARARGLEHVRQVAGQRLVGSRPARARGLELERLLGLQLAPRRAPHGRVDWNPN